MSNSKIAAYGSWKSPITTDLIVSASIGLGEIQLQNKQVYWIEMRPEEKGRYRVVHCSPDNQCQDFSAPDYNARTRVHEYGGGSYLVNDDTLFFTHFPDQRLYRQRKNELPSALTSAEQDRRFADFILDQYRSRLISVMEHHDPVFTEAKNCLVSINVDVNDSEPVVLTEGADFYSNPRLSPNGKQLCWLSWKHPNMPWDNTGLWLADVTDNGTLANPKQIAGEQGESVFQPEWSPAGELYFISDLNGWWNIYRYEGQHCECMLKRDAEFGVAQWSFRESCYAFRNEEEIICTWTEQGKSNLGILDLARHELKEISLPYTDIESLQVDNDQAVFLGGSPTVFPEIVRLNLDDYSMQVLRRSSDLKIEDDYLSVGESIAFPTENDNFAFAFYYPPHNADYKSADNEKPPLLVCSHGGPTGMARNGLKLVFQYFTSRGIAILDVNYGGSSGYGREYRQRLNKQWGIVDVDDCVNGARFLVEQGRVDENRLGIRGGSAGGFTTLAALTFRDVFKAGASRYGVSDLEALTKDTHKFESRYLDGLIGPYPETKSIYHERSPIYSVDKLSCPVIFLQGLEDRIVLPNQSEMMVEALVNKSIPVAYLAFEGEQHGFRQSENIKRALDAEFYFFSRVFDFIPADELEPVQILNRK